VSTTEDALERLESRRDELTDRVETLEKELEGTEVTRLKEKRDRIQNEIDKLEERIELLQSPLTANREIVNSEYTGILGAEHSLTGDTVRCWTCGHEVPLPDIEQTITELRETIETEKKQVREQEPNVEELTKKVDQIEEVESELEGVRADRRDIESQIDNRQSSLETLSDQLADIEGELENVTAQLEAIATDESKTNQRTELEETRVEIGTLEREIDRLEDECERLKQDSERRLELESEIADVDSKIEELTARIENIEGDIVEQFNDSMDELLEILAFEEIERIWLTGEFEVIVAREINGTVQRDSLSNLAESERELVGIMLGFAGFRAYDLSEDVPVLLLDSLGALDNERLHTLLTYFEDVTTHLIAAVQPDRVDYFDDTTSTVLSVADEQSPQLTGRN
jgi:DNA repair exonuclease SbcCD ATPase subunit